MCVYVPVLLFVNECSKCYSDAKIRRFFILTRLFSSHRRHATNNAAGHHHTLGRLPSQHMQMHHGSGLGPNNGKYATLSKQCKTLESSDFY